MDWQEAVATSIDSCAVRHEGEWTYFQYASGLTDSISPSGTFGKAKPGAADGYSDWEPVGGVRPPLFAFDELSYDNLKQMQADGFTTIVGRNPETGEEQVIVLPRSNSQQRRLAIQEGDDH